jgi:ABC-2 type transport system ATP-binding protein
MLKMEKVTKSFGKVQALDGVDLHVQPGEIYGFIGPNGAGKTTAIRVLMGFIRPDSGHCTIFGRNVWKEAVQIHQRVAYVPGDVNLWPNLTGGEVIDLFLRPRGLRSHRTAIGHSRRMCSPVFWKSTAKACGKAAVCARRFLSL